MDTADVVVALNPRYQRPVHLAPMIAALEQSWSRSARYTCHAPPQHGKTDTVSAFAVASLLRDPALRIAYVSYGATIAQHKSARMREWARRLDLELLDDTQSKSDWATTSGGGVFATGIGGALTGRPVDVLLIDDPYPNREKAESAAYRAMVSDWFADVANTRVQPGGSIYVWHTRWTLDDLIGEIERGEFGPGWEHVALPAINAAGDALWPERYPLEELARKRAASEYTWQSLYQGRPVARGGRVFGEPSLCSLAELPAHGQRAIGVDLAYSAKTHADWSVAVVVQRVGERCYVRHVERAQERAPEFAARLRRLAQLSVGAPSRWYCSGTERGVADLLAQQGVRIDAQVTHADKHTRAQACAAAWNDGQLVVPHDAPWAATFLDELRRFTGVGDSHDDQVDALVAAFDAVTTAVRGVVDTSSPSHVRDDLERARGMRRDAERYY